MNQAKKFSEMSEEEKAFHDEVARVTGQVDYDDDCPLVRELYPSLTKRVYLKIASLTKEEWETTDDVERLRSHIKVVYIKKEDLRLTPYMGYEVWSIAHYPEGDDLIIHKKEEA